MTHALRSSEALTTSRRPSPLKSTSRWEVYVGCGSLTSGLRGYAWFRFSTMKSRFSGWSVVSSVDAPFALGVLNAAFTLWPRLCL